MANLLISAMRDGDMNAILQGLDHQGAIFRMNALGFVVLNGIETNDVIHKIMLLKNDNVQYDGYTVSDFAVAVLDILNIEKYVGTDNRIKELIKSRFDFLR